MKKIQMRAAVSLLCLLLALLCLTEGFAETTPRRIGVASDLHIQKVTPLMGLANPLAPYNQEITDALLWDAARARMDVLILCGDITNQGRRAQHEMLTQKLRAGELQGLAILVLPGNHDIGEVNAAQFAEMYADFGYADAYSRDEDSLSYSALMGEMLFLMLDTNGYTGQLNAFLTEKTLDWAERQLELAKGKGWQVIAAGHYPLLTAQSTAFTGKEEMTALLEEYDVPLYLCGHLHGRNVQTQDGLVELVVDQTISFPTGYAVIENQEDGVIRYAPRRIDMSEWAKETGETREEFLQYDDFQKQLTMERAREIVERLKGDRSMETERYELAVDFFWQLMDGRALGGINGKANALREHPGYPAFMELAEGTIYSRWTPSVLENPTPYNSGFVIGKDRTISVLEAE